MNNAIHYTACTMGAESLENPGIEDLKTAIVHVACTDYLAILRGKTQVSHDKLESVEEMEAFFRGPWFCRLCSIDGELILAQMREKHKMGIKRLNDIHYGGGNEINGNQKITGADR